MCEENTHFYQNTINDMVIYRTITYPAVIYINIYFIITIKNDKKA